MLHRQLSIYHSNFEHSVYVNRTGPDDLEPEEAEPKGEKVGVTWRMEMHANSWEGVSARHTGSTDRGGPGGKTGIKLPIS